MTDCTAATTNAVHRLARDLCAMIEVHYLAEDMDECSDSLVPLYLARSVAWLPQQVKDTIAKIEQAVARHPHYSCRDCEALFLDTDYLGVVTKAHVELLDPGEIRPIGICPICSGDVHPSEVAK